MDSTPLSSYAKSTVGAQAQTQEVSFACSHVEVFHIIVNFTIMKANNNNQRQPMIKPKASASLTQTLRRAFPALLGFGTAAGITVALTYAHHTDTHFAKTAAGIARVHTIQDENGSAVRVLQLKGAYESATYLDERRYTPVFAYQKAFDRIFDAALPNRNILMIGGGGYAWPKHVIATRNDISLDVVEIDPAITAIAKKWFYLDELIIDHPSATERLSLITANGRSFLKNREAPLRYGAIINDTFSGKEPVLSLASIEAARLIKENLAPQGLYATNVVSECEGESITFLRQIVTTLNEVFSHVYIIPCEDADFGLEDNYLVLASDVAISYPDALPYDDDFLSEVLFESA